MIYKNQLKITFVLDLIKTIILIKLLAGLEMFAVNNQIKAL